VHSINSFYSPNGSLITETFFPQFFYACRWPKAVERHFWMHCMRWLGYIPFWLLSCFSEVHFQWRFILHCS